VVTVTEGCWLSHLCLDPGGSQSSSRHLVLYWEVALEGPQVSLGPELRDDTSVLAFKGFCVFVTLTSATPSLFFPLNLAAQKTRGGGR
jgi:hypothetical protein